MQQKKMQLGFIKRHPDGFGFFIPDDPEMPDIYIPKHSMKGAMTNDKVMVEPLVHRRDEKVSGEIINIVKRATTKVVGAYKKINDTTAIIKDEGGWGEDLKIKTTDASGAKENDLVLIEITTYPDSDQGFNGKVIQVLGSTEDPLTDIHRVVHGLQIPFEFSAEAIHQAQQLKPQVSEADIQGRKDLRHLNLITIDGVTAKDFDDAVYVESTGSGFKLYVAIADVSHYVRPGAAIDKDAYQRGTSVYFPNFVIPMLPEVLSNELCSLKPKVNRLAMVSEMLIDFNGVLTSKTFYEAVIESKARVTYGEAQEIIDGQTIEKLAHVQADILRAKDLAKILMAKRFRDGSLDLDIPEVQILLDGQGNPTDLIRSERLFAHRLIEELMLAANISVAEFFQEKDLPGVYRIHEPPNPDAIMMLERYLWNFGSKTPLGQGLLQKRLTKVLQEFENTPHAQILNILTLRSMSQAKYSANNVGHFGLGFANYSHFTSPIRRYPDLIAHRILKSQLYPNRYGRLEEDDLQTACTLLSACEQRAVKSERQFVSIKKARFMQKHVGEEFDGVISSVVKFGVFVLLRQFEVDGLVRLEQLAQERLEYDDEHLLLRGRRSGVTYRIGDIVKIKVADVNIQDGKIDFEFVEKIEDAITVEDALKNFADMPAHLKSFGQKQKSERESKGGFGNRNQKGNSRNQKNRNNRGGKNKSFSGQKAKGSDDNSFRGFGKQKAKDSDNNNFRGNNKNQKSFKGKSKHQSSNNNQRDQDNNPYRRNDSKNQNRVSGFRTDSKSAGRSPQKSNEIIEFEKPGQSNSEKPIKLTFEKPHKLTFEKPDKAGRSKFKKRGGVKALFKRKK